MNYMNHTNQFSKCVDLHMANGVVCKVTKHWWRSFLFKQAMDFHDQRPLETSQKVKFRSEYLAFCNAKLRCTDPDNEHYGARGIKFLFASFSEFLEEVGPRPKGMVLDRIDNNGNYEIGNLRWVTPVQSVANSRKNGGRPKGSKNCLTTGGVVGLLSVPRGTDSNGTVEQETSGRHERRNPNENRSGLVG